MAHQCVFWEGQLSNHPVHEQLGHIARLLGEMLAWAKKPDEVEIVEELFLMVNERVEILQPPLGANHASRTTSPSRSQSG